MTGSKNTSDTDGRSSRLTQMTLRTCSHCYLPLSPGDKTVSLSLLDRSPTILEMAGSGCQHCAHCQHVTEKPSSPISRLEQAPNARRSTDTNDRHPYHPTTFTPIKAGVPPFEKSSNRNFKGLRLPTAPIASSKPSLLSSLAGKNAGSNSWKWRFQRAPTRPKRPPLSQSPEPQDQLPAEPLFGQQTLQYSPEILQPDIPDISDRMQGSEQRCQTPPHQDVSSDPHRDHAYYLLTGEVYETHSAECDYCRDTVASPVESIMSVDLQLGHPSRSSLIDTVSVAALKPSPLRLLKSGLAGEPPPVPERSPYRTASVQACTMQREPASVQRYSGDRRQIVSTTSASRSGSSTYSSDEVNTSQCYPVTPPSTPPQVSDCCTDRVAEAVHRRSHTLQEVLGTHETCSSQNEKDTSCLLDGKSEISSLTLSILDDDGDESQTVSEIEQQILTALVQGSAKTQTTGGDADLSPIRSSLVVSNSNHDEDADFQSEQCEKNSYKQEMLEGDDNGEGPEAKQRSSTTPCCSRSSSLRKGVGLGAELGTSLRSNRGSGTTTVDGEEGAPPEHDSMISMLDLRQRLHALMEADSEENDELVLSGTQATIQRAYMPVFAATSMTGKVDGAINEFGDKPVTLQRIDIDYQGKRYPILIGNGAKLWEGPCIRKSCDEHKGRHTALRSN